MESPFLLSLSSIWRLNPPFIILKVLQMLDYCDISNPIIGLIFHCFIIILIFKFFYHILFIIEIFKVVHYFCFSCFTQNRKIDILCLIQSCSHLCWSISSWKPKEGCSQIHNPLGIFCSCLPSDKITHTIQSHVFL